MNTIQRIKEYVRKEIDNLSLNLYKQLCARACVIMWQNILQCRDMHHTSKGVLLKVSQRCILSLFTEILFGQLPWFVHHELMPCLRRGEPVIIKIFKKLCTLKHFIAVAASLLPTICIEVASSRLYIYLVLLPFLSHSKSRQPDRPASNTPSFYNPTSLMLASNF